MFLYTSEALHALDWMDQSRRREVETRARDVAWDRGSTTVTVGDVTIAKGEVLGWFGSQG